MSSFSIPLSSFTVKAFSDSTRSGGIIKYTGISLDTLRENLWPRFTSGAAGSGNPLRKESIASVFGVFFPATAGVFAGASMSGDLKNPSVSIPRGTLYGMGLTFFIYVAVIFAMAATVTRNTLYTDISVLQDVIVLIANADLDQYLPIFHLDGRVQLVILLCLARNRGMCKIITSHCKVRSEKERSDIQR